ncbi:MAG: intradiol ring-cleavage dioxygenase [Caldilineaceae bacterium]|nr:intradiol ring-cleavage dioxygenase [Caldilineaceae bacterium]
MTEPSLHHIPDEDDIPIGRILSRREVLTLFGSAGSALALAACMPASQSDGTLPPEGATAVSPTTQAEVAAANATAEAANEAITQAAGSTAAPACVVRPEVTEGPYYVDVDQLRSDVREGKAGAALTLTFRVTEVTDAACTPLEGAAVEIWHCDAEGWYSGVNDPGFNTSGETWLRGTQVTDVNGLATFTTIYPGWYSSRCVHIHFKVHPTEDLVFTSQLFFPDEFTNQVFTREPYADKGLPDTTNATDNIYQDLLLLDPSVDGDGYAAIFDIGVDMATVGTGSSNGGPGGMPPGGSPPPRPGSGG